MMPMYEVTTWDFEVHDWTPQRGVKPNPLTKWQLRKVLRQLQALSYETARGAPFVRVKRIEKEASAREHAPC